MKTRILLLVTGLSLFTVITSLHAQGTAFTYQGRLYDGVSPANGAYDLRFAVYDALTAGTQQGSLRTNSATAVSNGIFTVTLDFGNQFPGANRWLEIAVRTNGASAFTVLSPRQQLTPVPYAIMAGSANGLASLVVQQNIYGAPNMIGGSSANFVSSGVVGATIAGGGATNYSGLAYTNGVTGDFGTVSGGYGNIAFAYATVSGGLGNGAGYGATVGGGLGNHAGGTEAATVSGGEFNTANGFATTVSGGYNNTASGYEATLGGGTINSATGEWATVPGGTGNVASGIASFAAGKAAQALHDGSFVWSDATFGGFVSTADNQFSVHASGGIRLAGDVQLSGGAAYHNLSLSGGNAIGYLYGSYAAWGDGIHIGYNWYNDANGNGYVSNAGGGTSRLTLGYSDIALFVGAINTSPGQKRLEATTGGVNVYGTFNNFSDRNAKQDFKPVNSLQMLERVARLPISEWSYRDDPATRHIGPMAQDFYSVFNIGSDDKHIAPIDEGGLAFAAIQGLDQKVNSENAALRAENAELKQRLEALENIIRNQKSK